MLGDLSVNRRGGVNPSTLKELLSRAHAPQPAPADRLTSNSNGDATQEHRRASRNAYILGLDILFLPIDGAVLILLQCRPEDPCSTGHFLLHGHFDQLE